MCWGSIPSTSLSFLTSVQNWTLAELPDLLLVPGTWGLCMLGVGARSAS